MIISRKCLWAYSLNASAVTAVGKTRNSFRKLSYSRREASERPPHTPVLLPEVVKFLQPDKCRLIVDMTFGSGGHTRELLKNSRDAKILCLDRDALAYEYAERLRREYPERVVPLRGKFSDLPALLRERGYGQNSVDAMLFDFGCSSMQFDDAARGFSLSKDGPLDMRMDGGGDSMTAADVLAYAAEPDLAKIFKVYGEEKYAKKIARAVVETRFAVKPIGRTHELRDLVAAAVDEKFRTDALGRFSHPSTKVFQALRIFVNNEMNEINHAMLLAQLYLKVGGVLAAISFHSLEDTIVKGHIAGSVHNLGALPLKFYDCNTTFEAESLLEMQRLRWKAVNKHVITPNAFEIDSNPRCRSAKLRVAIKT